MTRAELIEMIRNGETSAVEFKRDMIDNRALAKEIVAFANFQGGQVILGVDDDSTIVGTTRPSLEEWVMTACRDKIRPEIIPFFDRMRDVERGKDVAVVRVERGFTVHHVWHDQHSSYYIRVGTVSREAVREHAPRDGFRSAPATSFASCCRSARTVARRTCTAPPPDSPRRGAR